MKSENDTTLRMAKLLEEMTSENSSHASGDNTESPDGNDGSLNGPSSNFGGDGQMIFYLLRLLLQKLDQLNKRLDDMAGASGEEVNPLGEGYPNEKIKPFSSPEGSTHDKGTKVVDYDEEAKLHSIEKQMEGSSQAVDGQLELLNEMIDAKVDSLQKMMKIVELYEPRGIRSTKSPSKEAKSRYMKLMHIKKSLEKCIFLDQCTPFVGSFNGDFVWKDKGSPVFSESGKGWHSCRLDCPVMKVGWTYQWTIEIQNLRIHVGVGIMSSAHQLNLRKSLASTQNGVWAHCADGTLHCHGSREKDGLPTFGSGDRVLLTLDLANVSRDKTTGGTLKAKVGGNSNEIVLFDDMIKQGRDIGMDFANNDGFYPAVSCHKDSRVKFLGFKSV